MLIALAFAAGVSLGFGLAAFVYGAAMAVCEYEVKRASEICDDTIAYLKSYSSPETTTNGGQG